MSNIQFRSAEHRDFFLENMNKCRVNDSYHRAFFYVMGIASETRANINQMFDFKNDSPEDLFCCEFAPYFMEGIKVRYPEYCRDLPAPRKQNELSR